MDWNLIFVNQTFLFIGFNTYLFFSSFSAGGKRTHVAGQNVEEFQNEAYILDDMNQT